MSVRLFAQARNCFIRRPNRIGHEPEIDQPREIAIAFGDLRCGRCIFDNSHFKSLFQQLMHVRLHAQVGRFGGCTLLLFCLRNFSVRHEGFNLFDTKIFK